MKAVFVELPAFARHRADEMPDLTPPQRKALKATIKAELEARRER
jgi:hypothetical protein